ncbi:class I SAM-dependent methyltransferase [Flavisphingopyxis soli]|nr:SAM-dependent methyltransferase [Sphingorhabdus soli]
MPDEAPLHEALSRTIERDGPIPIAAFMAQANTHYYATRDPLGAPNGTRGGDFVTAPEVSQMFGEMIGLWCADLAMRAEDGGDFAYVELGPGRGTLAADALRSMARFGLAPDVHLVETSPVLRRAQAERLPAAQFHDSIATLPDDRPLIIIANEFFDALPVAQFISTAKGWRERVVGRHEDRLIAMPGADPADDAVPEALRRQPPGMIVEHCPDAVAIAADLSARIAAQGGAVLIVDYGYQGPKVGDTLQSVRRHKIADPFNDPGEQDLSAHVDFTAIAAPANDRGLRITGPIEQGKFLHTLGLGHRAEALRRKNPERETEIISQYHRLTDAYEMGSLFKAMAMTAPHWPAPEGFA